MKNQKCEVVISSNVLNEVSKSSFSSVPLLGVFSKLFDDVIQSSFFSLHDTGFYTNEKLSGSISVNFTINFDI